MPSTPFARADARKPVLTPIPESHPQGQARACRTRACRSRYLVVRVKAGGRTVWRRQGGNWHLPTRSRSELSDMRPSLDSGSDHGGSTQRRPRVPRRPRCSKWGRSSKATSLTISSAQQADCGAPLGKPSGSGRHWSNKAEPVDVFDAKADAFAVLAAAGSPMQALQIGLNQRTR